jgi:putative chitinase
MITARQIADIMRCTISRAERWLEPLAEAMAHYDIGTPARQAAFLAQVGHESGRLVYVRELWNPVTCPWQARYEGREDLGNTEEGDGFRFRGRGLIQLTGRANYAACGKALGLDLLQQPELLEEPGHAAMSAAWYWASHGCNALADQDDFRAITLRINGGLNGYDDRVALHARAKEILGEGSKE